MEGVYLIAIQTIWHTAQGVKASILFKCNKNNSNNSDIFRLVIKFYATVYVVLNVNLIVSLCFYKVEFQYFFSWFYGYVLMKVDEDEEVEKKI